MGFRLDEATLMKKRIAKKFVGVGQLWVFFDKILKLLEMGFVFSLTDKVFLFSLFCLPTTSKEEFAELQQLADKPGHASPFGHHPWY